MANLIVSILAIVLMGALSVIGINYAGTIYLESQADAQASELVANATKVASAMRSWVNANGSTTFTDTNWSNGQPLDLINGSNMYLDALPQLGSYAQGNVAVTPTDYYFKAMPIANIQWANEGKNFDSLFAVITSMPVCKAIARLARGDSALPLARTGTTSPGMGDFSNATSNIKTSTGTVTGIGEFDCVFDDDNANGTLDSGESMFFIYKVL
jgi:hypothetical protein